MIKKSPIWLLLFFMILQSCNQDTESQLLIQREKKLKDREISFAKKEAEYQALLRMRDSILAKKDSVQILQWPEGISGLWNGKVVCTESSCSDYVIGDQHSDQWSFVSDSTNLVTKIINNKNLVRFYNGKYSSEGIKLQYRSDSTAKKRVEMNVILNDITPNKIRGTRTVTIDDNCTAKFSVELLRSVK